MVESAKKRPTIFLKQKTLASVLLSSSQFAVQMVWLTPTLVPSSASKRRTKIYKCCMLDSVKKRAPKMLFKQKTSVSVPKNYFQCAVLMVWLIQINAPSSVTKRRTKIYKCCMLDSVKKRSPKISFIQKIFASAPRNFFQSAVPMVWLTQINATSNASKRSFLTKVL